MNYERIYREFIADRRRIEDGLSGYTESHHILPVSLGGGNDAANLIRLTPEDHYFAHCCLAKIHGGKMWSALFAVANMAKTDGASAYFSKRRMTGVARERAASVRSDNMKELWASGEFTRNRVYKPHSAEHRSHVSAIMKGRTLPAEAYKKAVETKQRSAPRFDFIHIDSGELFSGTSLEFRIRTGMSQPLISCLTRKKIRAAKGWALVGTDLGSIFGRDPRVRQFTHKDGREWSGTRYDFIKEFSLDSGSVSKLIDGTLRSVKGWRINQILSAQTA